MKEQLLILWQLQQIEQQQKMLQAEQVQINSDDVRNLWQEIRLLTHNIAADQEILNCQRKVCATLEGDIAKLSLQCQQFDSQLYSGRIKNSRELEQLRDKQEMIKRDIHEREEEAFCKLEYCEQLADKIVAQEKLLKEKKGQHSREQQHLLDVVTQVEEQISALQKQYNELLPLVDARIVKIYCELKRTKREPIAKVDNGICGGCRRNLPMRQVYQNFQDLQFCDNCGRILFVSE